MLGAFNPPTFGDLDTQDQAAESSSLGPIFWRISNDARLARAGSRVHPRAGIRRLS